jgi:hypothetical protein
MLTAALPYFTLVLFIISVTIGVKWQRGSRCKEKVSDTFVGYGPAAPATRPHEV